MEGTPEGLSTEEIKIEAEKIKDVQDVHHIHIWNLDENRIALEAHVVVTSDNFKKVELIKYRIKELLKNKFNISHSTLEFENLDTNCEEN